VQDLLYNGFNLHAEAIYLVNELQTLNVNETKKGGEVKIAIATSKQHTCEKCAEKQF